MCETEVEFNYGKSTKAPLSQVVLYICVCICIRMYIYVHIDTVKVEQAQLN